MTTWTSCEAAPGTEWAGCGECAGFAGDYAPENWTAGGQGNSSPSEVDWAGAPEVFRITSSTANPPDSSDPNLGDPGSLTVEIAIPATGVLTFNWAYETQEVCDLGGDSCGSSYDPFGYQLDGLFTELTSGCDTLSHPEAPCSSTENGIASIPVTAGQVFKFDARTLDNLGGTATTTITNFCVGAA